MFGKAIALDTDVVGVIVEKLAPLCMKIFGFSVVVDGAGRGRMLLLAARFAAAWANERRFGEGKLKPDG